MPTVTDPLEQPVQFAREALVAALLCLADPGRKAEHENAAQMVAESVILAHIGMADELVRLHEEKHHG
jgi:hypothetical protein